MIEPSLMFAGILSILCYKLLGWLTSGRQDNRGKVNDVWIVTSGTYSAYGVDAAFSTVEAADAWAARMNANKDASDAEFCVERIDLDPPLPPFKERAKPEPDVIFLSEKLIERQRAWEEEQQRRLIESLQLPEELS